MEAKLFDREICLDFCLSLESDSFEWDVVWGGFGIHVETLMFFRFDFLNVFCFYCKRVLLTLMEGS